MSGTIHERDDSDYDELHKSELEYDALQFNNNINRNSQNIYNSNTLSLQIPSRTSSSKTNILKKLGLLKFFEVDDSSTTTSFLEDGYVRVVFHVHLPPKLENISRDFPLIDKAIPCVIGSIDELGNWENEVVPLKQPYFKPLRGFYGEKNSTYWVSEPVMIPISKFEEGEVRYKYAVQIIEKIDKKSIKAEEKKIKEAEKNAERDRKEANKKNDIIQDDENNREKLKGNEKPDKKIKEEPKVIWFHEIIYDSQDYRILNVKGDQINQFDIVNKINLYNRSYHKRIHDYEFFKIIWKSLTPENAKIKLKEYLDTLERFPDETLSAIDVTFIEDLLKSTSDKEKRLFLSIVLGYYIITRSNTFGNYNLLGKKFPSQAVFECIEKFLPENWLPNTTEILLTTLRASIVRDVQYDDFFWVKAMFTFAHSLDPDYNFLDCIYNQKFNEKYSELLVTYYFPRYVTPNINKIEYDETYCKIAKWMIKICCNMDQLLKVWSSSIEHTNARDILLRKTFLERVQHHISSVPAELLQKYFASISDDFKVDVAVPFRRATFALLDRTYVHKWTILNVDAIYSLLQNDLLEWTKEDHLRALEIISHSKSKLLLNKFPNLLKFWFNKYNKIINLSESDEIPNICEHWYYSMLSHLDFATGDWKYVHDVFENLSYIFNTIKNHPNILDKLIKIAIDRCNQCSDTRIFKATKHIHKFHKIDQDLVTPFAQMVKGKIILKDIDDSLLQKMQQICACKPDVLDVPNSLCEEILLYIVEQLKTLHPLSDKSDSEISSTSIILLRHSKFWNLILNPTGQVTRLKSHSYINQVQNIIRNFENILTQESITFLFLQRLLLNQDDMLIRFFNSEKINKSTINKLRDQCQSYLNKKDRLHTFYTRFCSQDKVKDLNFFLDDINERSTKLDNLTLKETQSPNHWNKHEISEEAANMVYELIDSQTFKNIFENVMKNEEGGNVSMEKLVKTIIPLVIQEYKRFARQYKTGNWETLKCSNQIVLWQRVNKGNIRNELDYLKIKKTDRLVQTMIHMTQFPIYIERLQQLNQVMLIFKVLYTKGGWLSTMLMILENEYLWLGALNDFFSYYNKHLSYLKDNCWELIKALSLSHDFVKWLRSIAEHNIRNLINSVDDQSDERLIQEETMSSLIQVHQVLVPLIKSDEILTIKKLLRKLVLIVDTNPKLGQKIELCHCNRNALENLVKNVDNKTEITQERISNSVKKGVFTFQRLENDDKCTATLSYATRVISETLDKQMTKFTLNDLLDLRGRALLISKPGITLDVEILGEEGLRHDLAKKTMIEFVDQVDLAQEICRLASELIQMGHFKYRRFNKNVKGIDEMEYLLDELRVALDEWKKIVNKAQEKYYYLTFFPARQILVFYDYFSQSAKDKIENIEECKALITFVNNNVELPPSDVVLNNILNYNTPNDNTDDDIDLPMEVFDDSISKTNELVNKVFGQSYYKNLCALGKILGYLFRNIYNKPKRVAQNKIERVKSDFVFSGKLFVAACNDKLLVPNIIMSLYVNHESYPQPWQILICTPSTTLEELSIFTKRCFFASKNGYDDYLFCIANLELVEFELQYQLVNIIRSMSDKFDKYLLALICCREPGVHHHILDQFSQDVHTTNGLDMNSMKIIYQELCPEVFCVTSEFSGLGKTEWIKNKSYELKKSPNSFLINDDVDFRTLVKRFKEFKIQPFESLHLNIVSANHPRDVNMFIFELLTLRMVVNSIDIARLLNTTIFIEIASTADQRFFNSIPIVQCLAITNLKWDIRNLKISKEIHSPIQIVCHYLNAYERTIDTKDLLFQTTGSDVTKPMSDEACQDLINKYLFDNGTSKQDVTSFRFIEIFINVFADQLIRFSSSQFFQVENLKVITKEKEIRKTLLRTFLDVSKDFATLSFKTKTAQLESITPSNNDKLATIVNWDDSNHLLVFFLSQTPDSICALYRDEKRIPENVKRLLKSQHTDKDKKFQLENYNTMDTTQLLEKLERLARKTMHKIKYPRYALSVDNLIKMALILLRARADIPVIVCGEAGCGKTSLIGFLSQVVEVKFKSLNLHAGVTEENILSFMAEAQKIADISELWLFFDEINTCNHIGLLADLIAHRMLNGRQIHPNIRLFAACNPYRIRTKDQSNVGLSTKAKKKEIRYEERSNLVYQVKPLPDQILDYVWDYGILQEKEEESYIQTMVTEALTKEYSNVDTFAKLIFRSQIFIRKEEEPYSVSLRDVKRAITLVKFFKDSFTKRPQQNETKYPPNDGIGISLRCYVLALGLCYQCRLYDQITRKEYREEMAKIISEDISKSTRKFKFNEEDFSKIIRQEQEDYINRMTCPPNTAKNEALLENVLVMIVCILTKIPVFIIGAPGSSKSLAVRLVSQNLKGFDSEDDYFRKLPQVYLIPHQGSSSSTSDGILKVFEKANNYQKTTSKEFPVISVVLLDEVGLAETSPFNPLKVLHYLLEPPYGSDSQTVSVIGISNWRLDNSKSSRALLVQRPKFGRNDLVDTAVRLLSPKIETNETNEIKSNISKVSLEPLADAYSIYEQTGQQFANFHGLRDYYALVKSLSKADLTPKNIQKALTRNFGGTDKTQELCEKYFAQVLRNFNQQREWEYIPLPIEDLINANLDDKDARHLMVIGKSDSIVNWLIYKLRNRNLDPIVIMGSQFPDDQDDYAYSVLSRIMMCVETGRPLILTDLEIIYGSLYDLWNQNYIVAGSADNPKYYTRVALADPPLLNRFEKQKMTIKDTLTTTEFQIVEQLLTWVDQMSKIFGTQDNQSKLNEDFKQKDLFIGFDPDETVQSLVIDTKKNHPNSDDRDILMKCKEKLVAIASSDGIIRAEKSELDDDEKRYWKKVYFEHQHHDSIVDYIQDALNQSNSSCGLQIIINTFSNINTDIKACLDGIVNCQVDKLSTFKTESQLQNRIKDFWLESTDEMLILQCDITVVNAGCIKLAKFLIEQFKNEYLMKREKRPELAWKTKHACIIMHIHREQENSSASFNFMCGWDQVTIETLAKQEKSLSEFMDKSIEEVINTTYLFESILNQELLWCLLCMKYPSSMRSIEHIKILSANIHKHPKLVECMKSYTRSWLQEKASTNWQYNVASNKKLLYIYPSLSVALITHIRGLVRIPIAKILCALEQHAAIRTFFDIDALDDDKFLLDFWFSMFNNKQIIDLEKIPEPSPDFYSMPPGIYNLKFPFSYYFMKQIDNFKPLYHEEINILSQDPQKVDSITGELDEDAHEDYLKELTEKILSINLLLETAPINRVPESYFKDFVSVIAYSEPGNEDPEQLELIFKRRLGEIKVLNPVALHAYWWSHGTSIIAESQIIKICPQLKDITDSDISDISEIIKSAVEIMLDRIKSGEEAERWKHDANKIITLGKKISTDSISLQTLKFYNDLLSIGSIRKKNILQIISLGQNSNQIISIEMLEAVFEILNNTQNTERNVSKRTIILSFLDIIPVESDVRIQLYKQLFSGEPLQLMSVIIKRIFAIEEEHHKEVFFKLIQNETNILQISQRLYVIDKSIKDLTSDVATLCCDIIQHEYFHKTNLTTLAPYLQSALEVICNEVQSLKQIVAIAFLKEFVGMFWDLVFQDKDRSIKHHLMRIEQHELLNNIVGFMDMSQPLIHSLKIYFLRDLRQRGLSFDDVKRFCKGRSNELSWCNHFSWETNDSSRLPFNPYWHLSKNIEAESAYTRLYQSSDNSQMQRFIRTIQHDNVELRLVLLGIFMTKFHVMRASREFNQIEQRAADFMIKEVDKIYLPIAYKQMIEEIMNNNHNLYSIDTNITSGELVMKSVLVHIVGLHASISQNISPLAAYLQGAQTCQSHYIIACQSDYETVLFNAVAQGGVVRYKCDCGFKYVIGDCGRAWVKAKCPECGNDIGGSKHMLAGGNVQLDKEKSTGFKTQDQTGYIEEEPNNQANFSIRSMIPASYRILHLFVHTLIAASATKASTTLFIPTEKKYSDIIQYCMEHIRCDWNILKQVLNVSDENLALLIHSILSTMAKEQFPQQKAVLKTSVEREDWEIGFSAAYILPKIQSVTKTAVDFKSELNKAMEIANVAKNGLEDDIAQELEMSPQYNKDYLPRLWRFTGKVSFDGFNAYYLKNISQNSKDFPFLNIYFKHEKNLSHLNHFYPIIKFVKMLHSKLAHKLTRDKAINYTFYEFIKHESKNTFISLQTAFTEFEKSWNAVAGNVRRYQCHDFVPHKLTKDDSVVFGLVEAKDSGIYLCAIIEYLVNIQNQFLEDVISIPDEICSSLKFLQKAAPWATSIQDKTTTISNPYHIPSKQINSLQQSDIINYEWDNKLLRHSQHNLGIKHGEEVIYDLQKIEQELAQLLVSEKVFIEGNSEDQLYMEQFPYHMELLHGGSRILNEIKGLITQEPIPTDKISLIGDTNQLRNQELLQSLEILLCFIKRISTKSGETLIKDFIDQWIQLSNSIELNNFQKIITIELRLKHIVALYELIEDQVANIGISYINDQFKEPLDEMMKKEICDSLFIDQQQVVTDNPKQQTQIPAEAFVIALKRYMQRFLCVNTNIKANTKLYFYLCDMSLNLWPDEIKETLVEDMFPQSLLVKNTYDAYNFVREQIQDAAQTQQSQTKVIPLQDLPVNNSAILPPIRDKETPLN
ncbi:9622_t:CDS:10, partial [Cetraspora pellucida]